MVPEAGNRGDGSKGVVVEEEALTGRWAAGEAGSQEVWAGEAKARGVG